MAAETPEMPEAPQYDVAISFLTRDESTATAIFQKPGNRYGVQ
jgi:hypothetical protein